MPQEIQVWYVIPALRREIAKCLVKDFDMTQREAAEELGVTEAAVSQYFKSRRAKEIDFEEDALELIRDACKRVAESDSSMAEEMYKLSVSKPVKKAMCKMHKANDPNVPEGCRVCFDE